MTVIVLTMILFSIISSRSLYQYRFDVYDEFNLQRIFYLNEDDK